MEFKALHVHALTEEVAANLEALLSSLSGIEQFKITPETQELNITFDEKRIGFQTLAEKMAKAGCPLRDIDAALLL
ncbi:MAG: heavy-metal-associated domain-containing protein [Anaerolineae bacterium]|nr:heavy-metal-associated domain-containing protein [Anaerolineae bacterium]